MNKLICFFFTIFCPFLAAETSYVQGNLKGQLGNQLFIVATTYTHAKDHDAISVFPEFATLDLWNIPLNREKVFSQLNTYNPHLSSTQTFHEVDHGYQPIPYSPNQILSGFFQSEKYFKHRKEEILELFAPSAEILQYISEKYSEILDHPKTVAVHVRAYKDVEPKYLPFLGRKHIEKAVEFFDKDSLFVVFSDDIHWCKQIFPLLGINNVVFVENNPHYIDLYLMSLCKHNIISNSTFSWWGAYLNQNPDKKVIAPNHKNWFGTAWADWKTEDLIPEEWIQLPFVPQNQYVEGFLQGQLGNQLFIIAATYSQAKDYHAIPVFPIFKKSKKFNLPTNRKKLFSKLDTFDPHLDTTQTFQEANHNYQPIPFHGSQKLCGFFQSEKYFYHHKEAILDLFAPSKEILDFIAEKHPILLKHPKTVSIHVRAYKDTQPKYHPFLGESYLEKAIQLFDEDSLFVVFSDDIPWCKQALQNLNIHNVLYMERNPHYIDLYLMSLCKHNIIANSSFSWWGAYLNKNRNKKVIAPHHTKWFGEANRHLNTEDLLPEEWIQVSL